MITDEKGMKSIEFGNVLWRLSETWHIIKSLTICIKNNHTDDNKRVGKLVIRNKSIELKALS